MAARAGWDLGEIRAPAARASLDLAWNSSSFRCTAVVPSRMCFAPFCPRDGIVSTSSRCRGN